MKCAKNRLYFNVFVCLLVLHVCVVCLHVCGQMCVRVQVCIYAPGASKLTSGTFLNRSPLFFVETGCLAELS